MDYEHAYTTYGDPSNPPIVMVHGIRLGRQMWEPHARVLSSEYHVVTVDLPGHGALTGMPFCFETIGEVFDEVYLRVCRRPPLVVGYSLGGYSAMEYAEHYPTRSRALLLTGCTLDFESWKYWPYELSARFTQMLPAPLFERFMWLSLHLTLPREWADLVATIPFDREVLDTTSSIARESSRFSGKLSEYREPVLFVNGEWDFIFRADERRFLHRIPQARLKIIPRVDHTAPLRRAAEFIGIVREFAARVFRTAAA